MKKLLNNNLFKYILGIIVALTLAFLVRAFVIERIRVVGDSMYPTLKSQEIVWCYKLGNVEREDVVLIDKKFYNNKQLVKRVIGIPGDTIIIKDGKITVIDKENNLVKLVEDYKTSEISQDVNIHIELKKDEYFVVGDNRKVSHDSMAFGPVKKSYIIGVVLNK